MTRLALSLGSNIEREKHLQFAVKQLGQILGRLTLSPVYESRAVGFDGPDFYNLVVLAETELSLTELIGEIRRIESGAGRVHEDKRFASRSLDIDVLLYGDANMRDAGRDIPRREIEHAAYVLKPLVDVLPGGVHPISGIRYDEMWQAYSDESQVVMKVDLEFDRGSES